MNTSFYVSLDKNALYHNIEYLREYKQKELLPVIKANAYGHNSLLIKNMVANLWLQSWVRPLSIVSIYRNMYVEVAT